MLSKDRSKLSSQQKRQLLESHSPELLGLAAELRERLTELRSRLNPVMDIINKTTDLPVNYFSMLMCACNFILTCIRNIIC